MLDLIEGLSPYTRGNLDQSQESGQKLRSIPVHTGKPSTPTAGCPSARVYPRTHGETHRPGKWRSTTKGLSPYTRGNLPKEDRGGPGAGSIPVHTGKPSACWQIDRHTRVYPRTHGETCDAFEVVLKNHGLSPYTRGNPRSSSQMTPWKRSIPVHTGKPRPTAQTSIFTRVYPRTHGETRYAGGYIDSLSGLSPYTRGNPVPANASGISARSIPVHTGKPNKHRVFICHVVVYPRTHGETGNALGFQPGCPGLSPYTRGNPISSCTIRHNQRSIPVHTGKPAENTVSRGKSRVYPRTHGETFRVSGDGLRV